MTKKKEFLIARLKGKDINAGDIYNICNPMSYFPLVSHSCSCAKCPLYKISYNCNAALRLYIKKMKKEDRLEFLIAIQ